MFTISPKWRAAYPDAHIGVLMMRGVANPESHVELDRCKEELENQLRGKFSEYDRAALKALPALQAYAAYYKQFKKTYHVQLQLESLLFKNRLIPRVAALVEAMFMAELKNLLLTAGHDLDAVQMPVGIDVAEGEESYTMLNGRAQVLKPRDMLIADAAGVISSIIYGPDQRTQITAETRRVMFTVYAPAGIDEQAVRQHLRDIQEYVMVITPHAELDMLEVYAAA